MARTSLKALEIPEGVTLEDNQGVITFTGKLGNMSLEIHKDVDINKDDSTISFSPNKDTKESLAITGTMRALTANYMQGVASGFEKKLEINGVGYRAALNGNKLKLNVGYSHEVNYEAPEGVTLSLEGDDKIKVEGINKQMVGQTAAEIRAVKKPEPYKGKGIRYKNEQIRRKAGKSGAAAA